MRRWTSPDSATSRGRADFTPRARSPERLAGRARRAGHRPWTERLFCLGAGTTTRITFPAALVHIGRDLWLFEAPAAPPTPPLARLTPAEPDGVRAACVDSVLRSELTDLASRAEWHAPCEGFHAHASDDGLLRVPVQLSFRVAEGQVELDSLELP